ncbi:hypothetical protein [Marinobacter caseinilyticus]|uniref:hypothetical protein n=1 Tax=Marinobacter caseinilyticus TaxID=2692195 RepID=UPI001409F026|nr:hypothetical protein [Marinobacter caseinilyticus]
MEKFTESIRRSIEAENWNAALFMSLTMPDLCGAIAYPGTEHSGPRYKRWFDENLADVNKTIIGGEEVVFLTASDCWALRCSLLHAGTADISEQRAQEVLNKFEFTTMGMHRIRTERILTLNVAMFCKEVCDAVEAWYETCKDDPRVQDRVSKILKIREKPFSPIPGVQFG